jgi:hypothetical protein
MPGVGEPQATAYLNNIVGNILNSLKFMEVDEEDTLTSTNEQIEEQIQQNNSIKQQLEPAEVTTNNAVVKKEPIKYFIDNGIQFKLDNGKLFKKVWQTVPIDAYMSEDGQKVFPEFRIINKETGKQVNTTKYNVQQLVWEAINMTD